MQQYLNIVEAGSQWRGGWLNRIIANPNFQRWCSQFPLLRGIVRKEGTELFEIVQGFVKSQVLMALVELDVFRHLQSGSATPKDLGRIFNIPEERMRVLLQAGAALGFLRRRRGARFGLARRGAILLGSPGLEAVIRHHRAFYRDLENPVDLLQNPDKQTELGAYWPYVLEVVCNQPDAEVARTYSDLMAHSQGLVALDTLQTTRLDGVNHLLDVGGGTGTFLEHVGAKYPDIEMTLFDLPSVISEAAIRFESNGLGSRTHLVSGSFRKDSLPSGAGAISLVRVLYDHTDAIVNSLLKKVFEALPPGGKLIISEPMSGGAQPNLAGDVYFAFYTMAMQTGRTRSASEIRLMCQAAGFKDIKIPKSHRDFVTRVLTASKPMKSI
ncbi:MAG: methyltransferase [Aestuariivita sp.]|nr:methyltransferase [Aestuariivita sp.]